LTVFLILLPLGSSRPHRELIAHDGLALPPTVVVAVVLAVEVDFREAALIGGLGARGLVRLTASAWGRYGWFCAWFWAWESWAWVSERDPRRA
jgi:hypothetical protein